jgi:hypothetical protein
MGHMDELRRMRRKTGGSGSFILKNGEVYRFDPSEAWQSVYMHAAINARRDYRREPRTKEVPEILRKIAQAKDRYGAVAQVWPDALNPNRQTYDSGGVFTAVDLRHLAETGELRPRLMAPSYPPVAS